MFLLQEFQCPSLAGPGIILYSWPMGVHNQSCLVQSINSLLLGIKNTYKKGYNVYFVKFVEMSCTESLSFLFTRRTQKVY